MKTSQAGTLESMDCLVTLEEAPGAGVKIEITGASAARFKSAMEKKINIRYTWNGNVKQMITKKDVNEIGENQG